MSAMIETLDIPLRWKRGKNQKSSVLGAKGNGKVYVKEHCMLGMRMH